MPPPLYSTLQKDDSAHGIQRGVAARHDVLWPLLDNSYMEIDGEQVTAGLGVVSLHKLLLQ